MCVQDLTWVMVVSSTGEYRWWVGRAGQGLGKCCPKVRDTGAAGNTGLFILLRQGGNSGEPNSVCSLGKTANLMGTRLPDPPLKGSPHQYPPTPRTHAGRGEQSAQHRDRAAKSPVSVSMHFPYRLALTVSSFIPRLRPLPSLRGVRGT